MNKLTVLVVNVTVHFMPSVAPVACLFEGIQRSVHEESLTDTTIAAETLKGNSYYYRLTQDLKNATDRYFDIGLDQPQCQQICRQIIAKMLKDII